MRRSRRLGTVLFIPLLALACGGNPEPEVMPDPPPPPPPPPAVDDSAERERAASRLCDRAAAAM
ncbi:MAG: serine hydrolase, partial [Gemmatimonadota bacterium]|nr:serine hydrolase [Gemmatimonadota bacterium]